MAILTPNKIYKDFDFSFTAHPETQDLVKKNDFNAVKQSIKNLLFTQRGERLFQPEVGGYLYDLLFEPMDPVTVQSLKAGIEVTLKNYEPRVLLERVDVFPKYDENEYEISIYFRVLGINQPTSLTLTLERLR